MLRGLYTAATSLSSAQHRHDITSHNLAHANVPGFRKLVAANSSFKDTLSSVENPVGSGTYVRDNNTDFMYGNLQPTGRPLDVGISGDAFFAVQTPSGQMFTRAGSFYLEPAGRLVTNDGFPVLDDNGQEIQFPADVTPSDITIAPTGDMVAKGALVGKLGLHAFANNHHLDRSGTTLFTAEHTSEVEPQAFVRQGFRETSNVSAVESMIQLISEMRQYEASQKVLTSIDQVVGQRTDPRTG